MEDLGQISASDHRPWPTGVRFHPTDEELVVSFLKKKTCGLELDSDFVVEINVYAYEPEDLPGLSKLKTGDRQWFFFSPRDPNYRKKAKTNRATRHGSWKSTGKLITVTSKSCNVGYRRTLVFYKDRGLKRRRTDWVMYEYTMNKDELGKCNNVQGYYSVYKVKKKSGRDPKNGEQYGAAVNEEDAAVNDSADLEVSFHCPESDPCANFVPQVGGPEVSVNTVADDHLLDHILPSSVEASDFEQQPSKALENESDNSQLSTFKTTEAKSAPNFSELASCLPVGDFIEVADLRAPEIHLDTEIPSGSGNSWFDGLNDSMCELDRHHDLIMFITREMGISLDDLEPFEDGTVTNPLENENVNHVTNPMDGQFQSNAGQIHNQMVMHNSATNGFSLSGLQPTSGDLWESTNFVAESKPSGDGEDT